MTNSSVKVLALIASLGALPLMLGLTGCVGDRHNQTTGCRIDDNRLTEPPESQSSAQRTEDSRTAERVREALAAGGDYKYDGVKVVAGNGIVQLGGLVNTSAQRSRAGEVARKVVGVKAIENNLEVR